jgi:ATP-dependent protease HslVU (ClpYQ) peptidase subunit
MSIVVVVKKAGKAVIAADTLYSFGTTKVANQYLRNSGKLQKVGDSYIGVVGATAHENVLDHLLEKEAKNFSFVSREDIFNSYLKLHPILKEKYFLNTTERENDEYESSQIDGLIANPNGIFGIYSLREVYEFERFWAIGSGTEFALGALFSTYDLFDSPEQIAEIAVKAACEFDDGCGLPLTIQSIKLEGE